MKNTDPALDLETMIEAAEKAISFVDGLGEPDFLSDAKTQNAVAMCLIVIGECAKRLTRNHPVFTRDMDKVPWRDMANMRDRIAHGYENLNMLVIWETVSCDLKPLVRTLRPILATLPDTDANPD